VGASLNQPSSSLPADSAAAPCREVIPTVTAGPTLQLKLHDMGFAEMRLELAELHDVVKFSKAVGHGFSVKQNPVDRLAHEANQRASVVTRVHLIGTREDVARCVDRIESKRRHRVKTFSQLGMVRPARGGDRAPKRLRTGSR